ncbi:TVA4 protein, partial [Picathartes gymnocephalus]|nr:TVA4 protein [Picathartes gymnocephalus]
VSLAVAAVRAQIEQEARLETTEGTGINIKCSHPNMRTGDFIHFYRQLPGRSPELVAVTAKTSVEVKAPEGRLWVSADR